MPVPYMNPYYFQTNPAFQQTQYQTMQNPYEQVAQLRNQLNPQTPYGQMYSPAPQQNPQSIGLNGEIVDSIDVVNAKNVDLSGNITYYPKADQSEIYTKQLQPDGRSITLVYRRVNDEIGEENKEAPITMDTLNNLLRQMKSEMVNEIKAVIPDFSVRTSRQGKGGASE